MSKNQRAPSLADYHEKTFGSVPKIKSYGREFGYECGCWRMYQDCTCTEAMKIEQLAQKGVFISSTDALYDYQTHYAVLLEIKFGENPTRAFMKEFDPEAVLTQVERRSWNMPKSRRKDRFGKYPSARQVRGSNKKEEFFLDAFADLHELWEHRDAVLAKQRAAEKRKAAIESGEVILFDKYEREWRADSMKPFGDYLTPTLRLVITCWTELDYLDTKYHSGEKTAWFDYLGVVEFEKWEKEERQVFHPNSGHVHFCRNCSSLHRDFASKCKEPKSLVMVDPFPELTDQHNARFSDEIPAATYNRLTDPSAAVAYF